MTTPTKTYRKNQRRQLRCRDRKAAKWMRRGERHLLIGDIDPHDHLNQTIVRGIYYCELDSIEVGPGKWQFEARERDNYFISWMEGGRRQRRYLDSYEEAVKAKMGMNR